MPSLALDTHAMAWHLLDSPRLSPRARLEIGTALNEGSSLLVSTISLVELHYLREKGKIPADQWDRLANALAQDDPGLHLVPLDRAIADAIPLVARDTVPDMPDRIIAATALHLGVPLVTRDRSLRALNVISTVW